jgi:hypothetical protein
MIHSRQIGKADSGSGCGREAERSARPFFTLMAIKKVSFDRPPLILTSPWLNCIAFPRLHTGQQHKTPNTQTTI